MMMDALALPNFDPAMTAAPAADVGDWAGTYVPRVSGIRLERYTDLLNEWISFEAGAERAVLRSGGGGARTFSYAGGHRLRAAGRVFPSHVLLLDPANIE